MARVCYFQCIIFIIGAVAGKLIREPEDTEAETGSTVTLHCQTDVKDAENHVEWRYHADNQFTILYKGGNVLNLDRYQGKIEVLQDPSTGTYDLKILNVSLSNAGYYTCEDDDEYKKAELIVVERYPSDKFCSLTAPTDCVLGKNKCSIDSDPIRMSCQLLYRASTELRLEWLNGQRPMEGAKVERGADGTVTSTIQLNAEEIQSGNFSCRLVNGNQKISRFVWTTTVNVTTIVDSDVVTEGDCEIHGTKCSMIGAPIDDRCEYVWTDDNRTVVARGAYLDLTNLPSENYTCLATCSIRQTSCSLVAEKFVYKCNKTATSEPTPPPTPSSEPTNLLLIISMVALPVVLFAGILIFLMRRRLSNQMKVLNEKEKVNKPIMQNEVKHGAQLV